MIALNGTQIFLPNNYPTEWKTITAEILYFTMNNKNTFALPPALHTPKMTNRINIYEGIILPDDDSVVQSTLRIF